MLVKQVLGALFLLGAQVQSAPIAGAHDIEKRDDADAAYLIGYKDKRDDADAAYLIGYKDKRENA